MELALQIVLVITSLLVILLVLLHRAKAVQSVRIHRGGEEPRPVDHVRHRHLDRGHRRHGPADQVRRLAGFLDG